MDVAFIKRRIASYPKKGDPLKKRQRMQEPEVLLQLGLDLMAKADAQIGPTRWDAVQYRDGLMIALLATRTMRLRNLTSVEIGRHLTEVDAKWSLHFPGPETKNHRPWLKWWPEILILHLTRYLEIFRPILLCGSYDGYRLWVSQRLGPLTDNGIYYAITTRTKAAFGRSMNPHLFRDAIATSLSVHNPVNVLITRHALDHANHATGQEFYNQADSIQASTKLNDAISKRRRALKPKPEK